MENLLELYEIFTEPERQYTIQPVNLSRRVQDNLLTAIQEAHEETCNLNIIDGPKITENKDKYLGLRIKRKELYDQKNSNAFEIQVYLPKSKIPNIRYFVLMDERGYHIAEIDNNYILTRVSKDAKTKERFIKLITYEFNQKLEKILENFKN